MVRTKVSLEADIEFKNNWNTIMFTELSLSFLLSFQAQFEFALAAVVEETHAMLDAAAQRQRHWMNQEINVSWSTIRVFLFFFPLQRAYWF